MKLTVKAGTMSLNLVVPSAANLKIEWFHVTKSQKSRASIAPFSKLSGSMEPLELPLTPALTVVLVYHLCKLQIESDSK